MSRAGREPAEDIKRRLVAACQEVGLTITNANMHLVKEAASRVIYVGASIAGRPYDTRISLMAIIPVTGQWPEFVDIRCSATEQDPVRLDGPWMKGRDSVPLNDLIAQLRETLQEREQVIAAIKTGVPGPYKFQRSVWEKFNPLGGIDP